MCACVWLHLTQTLSALTVTVIIRRNGIDNPSLNPDVAVWILFHANPNPNLWERHKCIWCRVPLLRVKNKVEYYVLQLWSCNESGRGKILNKSVVLLLLLYFDLRPGPKMLFQGDTTGGSDIFQWPVIERDRVGGLRLMIWDKVKVLLCHYSDSPEESYLWTAWQLFPLDDD